VTTSGAIHQFPIKVWALTVAGTLFGVFLLNIIVDPFNLTLLVTRSGLNAEITNLDWQSRRSKAIGLIRLHPEVLLLGSSVVDAGYRIPGSTNFDAHRLENLAALTHGPTPVYNSGIRGGGTRDAVKYLNHALVNTPGLKRVIAGFEWTLFNDYVPIRLDFVDSDLLYRRHIMPVGLLSYLTGTAFSSSLDTVAANQGSSVPVRLELLKFSLFMPLLHDAVQLYQTLPVQARTPQETRILYFSRFYSDGLLKSLNDHGAFNRKDRLDDIRALTTITNQNGVQLTVYVSPMHPLFWAYLRATGLWRLHLDGLRALANIVPFYDFSESIDFSTDVDRYFSGDPVHFDPPVGQRLLGYFQSGQAEPSLAPRLVTADNVEEDIERRDHDLSQWLERNPYVAEAVDRLKPVTGSYDPLSASIPSIRGEPYRGFLVVELAHRFYGVPASQEPFDLLALLRGEYQPTIVADTSQGVIFEIDRRGLESWTLMPADLVGGSAMSSGGNANTPSLAFNGGPADFWLAPERGREIKGRSWIGYVFATPQEVRRVEVKQPPAPTGHQDRVMVQASRDGGVTWIDVLPRPAEFFGGGTALINLPGTAPAAHWRIIAAGDDASAPKDVWAVYHLTFSVKADMTDPPERH
jgi:hypothetical protein